MPRGGTVQETPKRMAMIRSPPTIDSDRSRWLSPLLLQSGREQWRPRSVRVPGFDDALEGPREER